MLKIEDFSNKELISALCNWIDKETSGDNCGLTEDIRSGQWLKDLDSELEYPHHNS